MNLNKKILPCSFKPKNDELFSSWLVRLAYAHHSKTHTFYKILFPKISIWNRDIDKLAPTELIQQLSEITLNSYDTIFKTTLKSYEGNLYLNHNAFGNTKWILPLGIYHRDRKHFGLVFCPSCLKSDGETPYFRKQWRLAFSIICPTCNVFLHEKCPICEKPIIFFRNDLGKRSQLPEKPISHCYNCGFDLSTTPTITAPTKLARMQRTLYRIAKEGWNKEVIYPHQFFDVLSQLLKILVNSKRLPSQSLRSDLSKRFNLPQIPDKYLQNHISIEYIPLEYRRILIKQASYLLDDFPSRFIAIFKYHKFRSSDILTSFDNPPFWFYTVVYENFFVSNIMSNINRKFASTSYSIKTTKSTNSVVAPLKGLVRGKRKYSSFICPKCESNWIIQDGLRKKIQKYKCRNCGKRILASLTNK